MAEYSISELAAEFDTTLRSIRFYEEKGLLAPRREGQKRIYSAADRTRLKLILRGKRIGLSLEESAEIIAMYGQPAGSEKQLNTLLATVQRQRAKLLEQRAAIDSMLEELSSVENNCCEALNNLK